MCCPPALQLPGPVHLLGDVRQVEVHGKGTSQASTGRHVDVGEQRRGGGSVGAHECPYLLDEVQERPALLALEALPEQRPQPADVRPQGRVRVTHLHGQDRSHLSPIKGK